MSVWEWVETGLMKNHIEIPAMSGSFGVTIGDAVAGFFGARHTHLFGSDIKLLCDPEDMVLGQLEEHLPIISNLLGGVGGNTTFVYGTNATATYVGPKVEIRRAHSVSKTSDYVIPHKPGIGPIGPAGEKPADVIDEATLAAVAVLSILVILTPAALELALRFKYPKFGSKTPSDQEAIEGYGKTPDILKLCAYGITTRLMGLLKTIEDKSSWANFAEHYAKSAKAVGEKIACMAAACIPRIDFDIQFSLEEEDILGYCTTSVDNAADEDDNLASPNACAHFSE